MDDPRWAGWPPVLRWWIGVVLMAGVVLSQSALWEVPRPPMRSLYSEDLAGRCALLEEIAGEGTDAVREAGLDEAVPALDVTEREGARVIAPADIVGGLQSIPMDGSQLVQPADEATVVVRSAKYDDTLSALRKDFAEQAEQRGWTSASDAEAREEHEGDQLVSFADIYEGPDSANIVRSGEACERRGWFAYSRTVVPATRTGACADAATRPRCERLFALTDGLADVSGFTERGPRSLALDADGRLTVSFEIRDDGGLGRAVEGLVGQLEGDGWTWNERADCPDDSPITTVPPFDLPTPIETPITVPSFPTDLFETQAAGPVVVARFGPCGFFGPGVPTDRPTSYTFGRTIDGIVFAATATFTPVPEPDPHGDGTNDIEAGFTALITVVEPAA